MPKTSPEPRQPPYSIDAEQSVLGGILLENRAFDDVADLIAEADFYRADHQLIWRAIARMIGSNIPCDFVTLSEHLRSAGQLEEAGGLSYLGGLCNETPSAANVLAYAQIVRQRSILRSLIAAGGDIAELGYRPEDRPIAELIDEAQRQVLDIGASRRESDGPQLIGAGLGAYVNDLWARAERRSAGLPTGFGALDRLIGGLEGGDFMILAARPSMGKTALAMGIADNASQGRNVLVFSAEMTRRQLIDRLISSRGAVPLERLRQPWLLDQLDHDEVVAASSQIGARGLIIDDSSQPSLMQVRARARRCHRRHPLSLIVIDYLQLMTAEGEKRYEQVDAISRGLKGLAKELGVPVIALSQLNRNLESRDDKRPRMSDLREAGGIEQDADFILGVYRDEYYHRASPHQGVAEILVLKQRNGPTGSVDLQFDGPFVRFLDWTGPDAQARIAAQAPPEVERPSSPPRRRGFAGNGASHAAYTAGADS